MANLCCVCVCVFSVRSNVHKSVSDISVTPVRLARVEHIQNVLGVNFTRTSRVYFDNCLA